MGINYKKHAIGAVTFASAATLFQHFGSKTYPVFHGVTKFSMGGAVLLGVGIYALRRLVNDVLLQNCANAEHYSWKKDLAITLIAGIGVGCVAIGFSVPAGVTGASMALVGFLMDLIAKNIFFGTSKTSKTSKLTSITVDLEVARKHFVLLASYQSNEKNPYPLEVEPTKEHINLANSVYLKLESMVEKSEQKNQKENEEPFFSDFKREEMRSWLLKLFNDKNEINKNPINQKLTIEDDFIDELCAFWLLNQNCKRITVNRDMYKFEYSCYRYSLLLKKCSEKPLEILKQELSSYENQKKQVEELLLNNNLKITERATLTDAQKIDNGLMKYLQDAKVSIERELEDINKYIEIEENRLKPK